MKKLALTICFYSFMHLSFAQVGIGNTNPDASSILDISATDKGVLIPRVVLNNVTTTMLDGVNTSATGLLIYNTNAAVTGGDGVGYYYFNGTIWERLTTSATSDDDNDWYEEGTTTSPDNINDDMFTQGNVAIGKTTADFKLDIEETTGTKALNISIGGAINNDIYGTHIQNSNTGTGLHFGSYYDLTGVGAGGQFGSYQDISNTGAGSHYGSFNLLRGTGAGVQTGSTQSITNTGSGFHYGSFNWLSGAGTGEQYGIKNIIENSGNALHYGVYNTLTGNGAGTHYGTYNALSGSGDGILHGNWNLITNSGNGSHYGVYNSFTGNGSGLHNGVFNIINGSGSAQHAGVSNDLRGTGNGNQLGIQNAISNSGSGIHYGMYNSLSGSGLGSKYGIYSFMHNTAGGTHFGVYSETLKAGSYAGYFLGNVSVGTTAANNYIFPASRGINGQIMQTDGSGNMSWTTPLTGDIDDVVAGDGLIGGSASGTATLNVVAINGLNDTANDIRLGGSLIQNTTINQGSYGLNFNLNGTGDFRVQDVGVTHFEVRDTGITYFGDDTYWNDASTSGTTLARLYDSGDDGVFQLYSNGSAQHTLNSVGATVFNEQGTSVDFRIESNTNTSMFFVDASTNRVGIGTTTPVDRFHVSGGRVEFTATTDASGTGGTGVLEIANSLRLDGDEIITNSNTTMYLQNGNNGDLSVDGGMLTVDASTNRVGIGTTAPVDRFHVSGGRVEFTATTDATAFAGSGVLEIANSLRLDGNEIITNTNGILSIQADNNGDFRVDSSTLCVDASTNSVGIGTTFPSFQLTLTTNSAAKPGSSLWTVASDERLKKDVKPFTDGMNMLSKINPVWFTYNGKAGMPQDTGVGTIAQEFQKIAPYMVKPWQYTDDDKGISESYLGIDYGPLTFVIVNALQEQQAEIEHLKEQLEYYKQLEERIKLLEGRN